MSLYIHETGTHGAPTIIFIHGIMTNGQMWDAQIESLSDFHCLVVDLPGHGKSNHIKWVSTEDTAHQIAEIIRTKTPHQQAHVVGLSLGAYVVLDLIIHHPDCVTRAIMSGVTIDPLPNKRLLKIQVPIMSLLMKQTWFINWQAKMLHIPDEKMTAYIEGMKQTTRQTFLRVFDELLNYDYRDALSHIQTPTLVVAGELEAPLIASSVSKIAQMMPHAEGRIAQQVHHGWNIEAPDLFTDMLRAWFMCQPLPEALKKQEGM